MRPAAPSLRKSLVALTLSVSVACGGSGLNQHDRVIDLREAFLIGSFPPSEIADSSRPVDDTDGFEARGEGQAFVFTSSGSLVVPIDPVAAEGLFQFDLRFRGSGSSPSSLSVSVLGSDGQPGEPTQLTHRVDVWKTAEIALAGRPDGIFFVVLKSESSDESQTVELRAPRIRVAETAARSEAEPDGVRTVAAADLPNVLIVLLDAARPLETPRTRARWNRECFFGTYASVGRHSRIRTSKRWSPCTTEVSGWPMTPWESSSML